MVDGLTESEQAQDSGRKPHEVPGGLRMNQEVKRAKAGGVSLILMGPGFLWTSVSELEDWEGFKVKLLRGPSRDNHPDTLCR